MKINAVILFFIASLMMLAHSEVRAQVQTNEEANEEAEEVLIDTSIEADEANMKGALNGSITNDKGETLSGVLVNLSGGETDQQLATTDNGWYQFVDVEPGEYQLTITAEGYETVTADAKIESGDTNKINFELKAN